MPQLRLYHMAVPGYLHARAFRCIWVLEELGVKDYEVCMLTPGVPYAPQMREYGVKAATKLPTMVLDGDEIGESAVISQLLAERFAEQKNLLGTPAERYQLLQWMAFAETCVMLRVPYLRPLLEPGKTLDEIHAEVIEPQRQIIAGNRERFETHFSEQGSDYLLASGFSVADTMCGWSLNTFHDWQLMALATGASPLTLAYLERLRVRPAFKRAEAFADLAPGLHHRPAQLDA